MAKNFKNKSTRRKHPSYSRASKSQRIRRAREMSNRIKRSTEEHFNNNSALENHYGLPVISAVHGKNYFEKHPFSVQLIEEHEVHFETPDSTVIKTECCEEENNLHDEMDVSVLKTDPETLQHHLKDHNITSNKINNSVCNFMRLKAQTISFDKENKLLIDIIKYLDECAKVDKFDLAGKLYAAKLRSVMYTNQQAMAENLCRQVLLEAEHFNLDEKIVLSKEHPHDYLSYRKSRVGVTNKSNREQSYPFTLKKDTLFQNIQNRLSQNTREDRFDKFGKFYAIKMRSFSDIQYFYADKLINEIVLEAELCRLRANFKLTKSGDPPSHTFATGKSYANKYRRKDSTIPASDISCASNKTPLKLSDQISVTNIRNSDDKHFTYSSFKPSLATLTPIPDVTSIKNNVQQFPKSKSSLTVCKTVLKKRKPKKKIKEYVDELLLNDSVNKGLKNSSFKPSIASLSPTTGVISVQNSAPQFPESLTSSSISNTIKPNPKETRQSANKQVMNSSVKGLKNYSLKPSILPLMPTPSVVSIQNNVHQFPGTNTFLKTHIPNTESASNILKLLSFNQSCQDRVGFITPCISLSIKADNFKVVK